MGSIADDEEIAGMFGYSDSKSVVQIVAEGKAVGDSDIVQDVAFVEKGR